MTVNKIADVCDSISVQVERANLVGDSVFLLGPFNADLGKETMRGEIKQMKNNWACLNHIMGKYNLAVLNALEICSGKEFTPWRSLKHGKRYSDHNAVLIHMSVITNSKRHTDKRKLEWNFNDLLG